MSSYAAMSEAIKEARETLRLADSRADDLAEIIVGRLRKVHSITLCRLKRELTEFNSKTRRWRS